MDLSFLSKVDWYPLWNSLRIAAIAGVLVFFLWMIKLVTGVSMNIPRMRLSKVLPKRGPGLD